LYAGKGYTLRLGKVPLLGKDIRIQGRRREQYAPFVYLRRIGQPKRGAFFFSAYKGQLAEKKAKGKELSLVSGSLFLSGAKLRIQGTTSGEGKHSPLRKSQEQYAPFFSLRRIGHIRSLKKAFFVGYAPTKTNSMSLCA